MRNISSQKGFTLVELSIVLVIIGLLIGGILVGQSLINTARVNSAVRDLSSYTIALETFKSKYKQLPGDSNLFSDSQGNNNKLIGDVVTPWNAGSYEFGRFWYELSIGVGLKNSKGVNYKPFVATLGSEYFKPSADYSPQLKLPQYTNAKDFNCLCAGSDTNKKTILNYKVYYNAQLGNPTTNDPLLAIDTMAIDSKIDDGKPATGNFTAKTRGTATTTQCDTGTGEYNLTSSDFICSFTSVIN